MKSVTEFWYPTLEKGLKAKAALVAEGKSAEEVQTSLGESFKYEGDKLKHFVNSMEVASQNVEKLARVLVVQLTEGESVPPKAVQVETHYYIPEFQRDPKAVVATKPQAGQGGGGRGGRGGGRGEGKGRGGDKKGGDKKGTGGAPPQAAT